MDSHSSPVAARLLALEGEAWLRHGGERLPLSTGSELAAGDVLETGADAQAQLALASGNALAVGPDQLLCLDADVLATDSADTSEWRCALAPGLDLLAGGPALTLDSVLEPSRGLDHLLGGATAAVADAHVANAHHPHAPDAAHAASPALVAFDDPGLQHLLRSLFGPEAH